ncbi:MAG: hypothetical protein V3R83_12285 [Gammaproteobacteria bacterium]
MSGISHSVDEFDTGASGEGDASPDALSRVRTAIQNMLSLSDAIASMEDDLKAACKSLQIMRTVTVPDLMMEIQSDQFNHAGWEVKLTDFVSGSFPKDVVKREAAMKWLKEHDGSGLIKTDVSMSFGRSQHNEAICIAQELLEAGHPVNIREVVHPQTLQSYARTRIREGDDINTDLLGLYVGKVVKIKKLKP